MGEHERPVIDFVTPVGKTPIVLKAYVTGGEMRQVENIFVKGEVVNGETRASVTGELVDQAQDTLFRLVVIKVGEVETVEGIVPALLNLPKVDFDAVVKKINEIVKGTSETPEKKKV